MCGICGVYNYIGGEPAGKPLLRLMADSMIHRGPDDDGYYFDGAVGLGMRRLSIIDLEGGAQPIANEDESVQVICNGEIYNFDDLRRELEALGHDFKTRSDTETIVHAYEEWGLGALTRLNGMFALAIWDSGARTLIIARDPFGVKPLYYFDKGRSLVFASEIRAILRHPRVERRLDPVAVDQFFTLRFVPSPRTILADIKKLPPGRALVCARGSTRLHRFHRTLPRMLPRFAEEDIVELLRERIAVAVRRQMAADVPIGVMLSGGVDSSTVATLMAGFAGEPIKTFTVGFDGDFPRNEFGPAREMARLLGSEHHEVMISADEYAQFLPRAVRYLEEPIATTSTLPFYKLCELARQHVKVVLTGQGGDEPFAGYPRHLGERYGLAYRALPAALRKAVASAVRRLPRNEPGKRAVMSLGVADPLRRMLAVHTLLDADLRRRLYSNALLADCRSGGDQDGLGATHDVLASWQSDVAGLDALSQMLYVDARMSLPDSLLMYADKMSMAVSLEARVPFLDLELMALAESIPPQLKIRGLAQKHILKEAVSKWLPPEIIARKKVGFDTPIDQWFRQDLSSVVAERLLSPGSACRTYFNASTVSEMLESHKSGRQDYKRVLFSLLTFEIWYEEFMRSPVPAARVA